MLVVEFKAVQGVGVRLTMLLSIGVIVSLYCEIGTIGGALVETSRGSFSALNSVSVPSATTKNFCV